MMSNGKGKWIRGTLNIPQRGKEYPVVLYPGEKQRRSEDGVGMRIRSPRPTPSPELGLGFRNMWEVMLLVSLR